MLSEQVNRIKNLMVIKEEISKNNLFSNFDTFEFKNTPPPNDNSEKTKKEICQVGTNKMQTTNRIIASSTS
jgi:hypothetical protein